ncbi:hypothetical protein ACTNDP_10255 [Paenibacillus barengoltzii]|jgi:hypothetical protein|uniref:hypothetical protein n=1 Tax=Paenibacillus barengoltzii TaxID=343517 RepID=UPI003F8A98FA
MLLTAPKTSLPQLYALRLERIQAKGIQGAELVKLLERKDSDELQQRVDSELQWDGFVEYLQEHWDDVKQALTEGYRFKFMTVGGLRSLLEIKFGLQAERDYVFDNNRFAGVRLHREAYQQLRALAPDYWEILIDQEDPDTGTLEMRIEHKYAD